MKGYLHTFTSVLTLNINLNYGKGMFLLGRFLGFSIDLGDDVGILSSPYDLKFFSQPS